MEDIAARTLEDEFPELTPQQVRQALNEALGDLTLAAAVCQRLLGSTQQDGGAGDAVEHSGSLLAAPAGGAGPPPALEPFTALQAPPQHRHWWPAAPLPPQPPDLANGGSAGTAAQNGPAAGASHAPAAAAANRPGVRVLQSHGAAQPNGSSDSSNSTAGRGTEGIHYAGVFLAEPSRDRVLQHAPPLHESVSADHMTLAYRPSLEACLGLPLGEDAPLFVEGVAADYRAQALAVQHPTWLPFLSESSPHVTVSVAEGVPAKEAGELVAAARAGSRARIVPLVGLKLLHGRVGVKLDDGTIAYSAEELQEGLERLRQRAPALDPSAPVRLLKRGEAPPPRPRSPPPPERPAAAAAAPRTPQHPPSAALISPTAAAAAAAGAAGGPPGLGLATQQQVQVSSYSSPTSSAITVAARTSAALSSPAPAAAAAAPSLDELLDMLHLAECSPGATTTTSASIRTTTSAVPGGGSVRTTTLRQGKSVGLAAPGRPAGAAGRAAAGHSVRFSEPQEQQPPPPQQQQQPGQALAAAARTSPGAPLLVPHHVPQRQKPETAAPAVPAPQPSGQTFADLGGMDDAPLDMLTALAERLGSGGNSSSSTAQQAGAAAAGATASPPSFNPLPLFQQRSRQQQQQQQPPAQPAMPGTKAPAQPPTLADFLPSALAGSPTSAQHPPPQPFFLDAPSAPSPTGVPAAGVAVAGRRGLHPIPRPPQRQSSIGGGSAGGYESSSSSGAEPRSAQPLPLLGSAPQTERDLQEAFPGIEPEVLAAALEIHGGDAGEAASFLAALEMQQQETALAGDVDSRPGASSPHARQVPSYHPQQHHHPQQQQQQLRPGQRKPGGAGAGRGGGRGRGQHQRAHTGASDPLAVAERQAMSLHLAARNMYEKAARAAAARGNLSLSKELEATSRHHADMGNAARRRANSTAYRTSNSALTNTFKVDLHGLHVEEALQVLERHLVSLGGLGHPGGIILEVVTGVGRHSSAGQPRLLPAVVRFLSDAGYRFDTQEGNTGVILVFIGC